MPREDEIRERWDSIYRVTPPNELPWETGKPSPELARLVEQKKVLPGKALDICCGLGVQSIYLAKKGFQVTGIDISETAIRQARENCKKAGVKCRFLAGNAYGLKFPPGSFSFVFDRGCFHHIPQDKMNQYIRGIHYALKGRGKYQLLAFSKRNRWGNWNEFSPHDIRRRFSGLFEIREAEEVLHVQPGGEKVWMHSVFMEKRE